MSQLSKSPQVLAKEEEIKDLRKQLKKRTAVLKSLNTRLSNTNEEITDFSREMQRESIKIAERIKALRDELRSTFEKAQRSRLSKKIKAKLSELQTAVLQDEKFGTPDDFFDDSEEEESDQEQEYYEQKQQYQSYERITMEEDEVADDKKEDLRQIRKVYLRLSQQFHPDRASDEAEAEQRHTMMLRINTAYKNNDIHTLLEIEREYGGAQREDILAQGSVSFDALEDEIKRLEHELQLIENQIERTSKEIKEVRKSEAGQMLTESNRIEREGEDPVEFMFDELLGGIEVLEHVHEAVQETIRTRKLHPVVEEILTPDPFEAMLAEMLGVEVEPAASPSSPTQAPEEKPLFKRGQLLYLDDTITYALKREDVSFAFETPLVKVTKRPTWNGNEWEYEVHPDKSEIDKLPASILRAPNIDMMIQTRESLLRDAEDRSATTWQEDALYFRKLQLQYIWEDEPELGAIVQRILLHPDSTGDDTKDWLRFFGNEIKLPVKTKRIYPPTEEAARHVYPILELYWAEDRSTFRAKVQGPRRKQHVDINELELLEADEENGNWLDAHREWQRRENIRNIRVFI